MDYQLVVVRGRSATQVLKLAEGVTVVGRAEGCTLRIRSSQVSRKHCEIFEKKGLLLVKDLGSANGTYVNGKKIDGQRVIEPGDVLLIGSVKLRVAKEGVAPPAKPARPAAPSPADTAVAEEALGLVDLDDEAGDDQEFDIDFDDDATVPSNSATPLPSEAPDPVEKPAAKAAAPGAASPKPAPKPPEPSPDEAAADDAIADFLMGIKLEDDK